MPTKRWAGLAALLILAGLEGCCSWCQRHCGTAVATAPPVYYYPQAPACCVPAPAPACCVPAAPCCAPASYPPPQPQWQRSYDSPADCCQ